MNLNSIIDGILLPRAEIDLGFQETKGRIDLVLSLSSLLKSDLNISQIFELLRRLTFKNLCIAFAESPESKNTSVVLTFDEVILRRTKEQAILFKDGYIIIDLASNGAQMKEMVSKITIRSLTVKISSSLINEAIIIKKDLLAQKSVKELSVNFLDDRIALKGCVNKITSINFSADIYTEIKDELLLINIANINLMNFLAVPSFVKNIVIDLVQDSAKLDFVDVKDNCILINPYKLAGSKIDFGIKQFRSEKGFLFVELGKDEPSDSEQSTE